MQRILIIDPDAVLTAALEHRLRAGNFAVDTVATGRQGIAKVMSGDYQLVVLERRLPDLDGITVVSTMRGVGMDTPILIVSTLADVDQRIRGLRAGSDDYLAKPFSMDEMLLRVQYLLRRGSEPAKALESVLRTGPLELDLIERKVRYRSRELNLLPTEMRLLEYMMRHVGQVLTRSMIFEAVWGRRAGMRTNLIDVHIGRLRRKVDPSGEQPLIRTVRGFGYVFG